MLRNNAALKTWNITRRHQQQLTVWMGKGVHVHICDEELSAIMLNSKTLLILLFFFNINLFILIGG